MQLDSNSDLEDDLVQWGHWSRCAGINLALHSGSGIVPDITDDRALEIDRIIGLLGLRDEVTAGVLKCKYIQQMSVRDIGKVYNINKDKAASLVKLGVGCVAMGLDVRAANDDFF